MKKINYRLFKEMVEKEQVMRISEVENIVDNIIEDNQNDIDNYEITNYEESNYKKLYDIACMFGNDSLIFIGADDDYHNLSVKYAKEDYYDCACKILIKGLKKYPYSVDLLSDYLSYSIQSEEFYENSQEYYGRLKKISFSDWNWRAFSFSIDYLLDKKNREYSLSSSIKSDVLLLADIFIKNASDEYIDQAYFYKSMIFKSYNENSNEKEVLELGIKNTNRPIKCCYRLADIEFNSGNYDKAISYIDVCWRILNKVQSVNEGYTFLLLALSKTSKFLKTFESKEVIDENLKTEIELIYKDFNSAYKISNKIYRDSIKDILNIIETQTGVKNKYNMDNSEYDF